MSSGNSTTFGSVASSFSLSGLRMVASTVHPRDAKSFAAARPSPEELPVMKMVLDCWSVIASSLRPLVAPRR
jgi:hypothetical protein